MNIVSRDPCKVSSPMITDCFHDITIFIRDVTKDDLIRNVIASALDWFTFNFSFVVIDLSDIDLTKATFFYKKVESNHDLHCFTVFILSTYDKEMHRFVLKL